MMRRELFLVPLLGLAPLGHFLGGYWEGMGYSDGFFIGVASFFLLPFIVSTLFCIVSKAFWFNRVLLFFGTLVVQVFLLFVAVPSGAECGMIGLAHRLKSEFPLNDIRSCAGQLRIDYREDKLKGSPPKDYIVGVSQDAHPLQVADSNLQSSLRGRFKAVVVQKSNTGIGVDVVFSLGENRGIICSDNIHVDRFFMRRMADGIYAFSYQRS